METQNQSSGYVIGNFFDILRFKLITLVKCADPMKTVQGDREQLNYILKRWILTSHMKPLKETV